MSAYIESDNHVNVIVSWFAAEYRSMYQLWCVIDGEYNYLTKENAGRLAYRLWQQNVLSVNDRYKEMTADEGYHYTFIPQAKDEYSIGEIAMALDGLEYQSCESDDYHKTEAWENICLMRKHLLKKISERAEADTWSINEVKPATRQYMPIIGGR